MDLQNFQIDENRLDREWILQPERVYQVSIELADAQKELAEARNSLESVTADLSNAIRQNPEKYNIEKVTEKAVESVLLSRKTYKDAQQLVIDCKHRVDTLQAQATALDHKKRALENLVDLHGMGYFSEPRTSSREGVARVEERSKESVRRAGSRKLKRPNREEDGE